MEVKLDKRYPVAAGVDACWSVLRDIRAVAACMPGAQITEQIDDTHFKGTVKSKVGPAVMSFGGDIELQGLDAAERRLQMLGKGADKSGSSASMQLTAHVEPDPADAAASVLVGVATIIVSGKLAQFGSRLLVPVSDAMLAQFADNFRAAATTAQAATPAAAAPSETAAPSAPPADATSTIEAAAAHINASASASASASTSAAVQATAPVSAAAPAPVAPAAAQARPAPTPVAPVKELNALGLLWTVFKGWLAGLFGSKK